MKKPTEKTVYPLRNVDCPDCAAKLEKMIGDLAEVEHAQVNLMGAKLIAVHHGQDQLIRNTLARHGYLSASQEANFWLKPQTLFTLATGLLLLTGIFLPQAWSRWLLVVAVFTGGVFPALAGFKTLFYSRSFDINFLMTVAVIGAVTIGELTEAATVVFLFAIGNALEFYTIGRTRRSISSLLELAPETAWLLDQEGQPVQVAATQLQPGQIIMVKPGERIPADGLVCQGTSEVNQAAITGEAMPVTRQPGDDVFAGSINGTGQLTIRVSKAAAESTLARIVSLVEQASTSRPPIQQFVDRFARWYTPMVIALASAIALVPPLVSNQPWPVWIYRGLTLLVVACPCALVISTPVSIVSALGNAARKGVLIKTGAALEKTAAVKTIAMDKTGTLTAGRPQLTGINPADGLSQQQVLALAAAVEQGTSHPLAAAVVGAARAQNLPISPGTDFRTLPGHGAVACIDGKTVYAVSPSFARHGLGLNVTEHSDTAVVLAADQSVLGQLKFQDMLRKGSFETIASLGKLGVETVMLTGDNPGAATAIAQAAGITRYYSRLLPQDKLNLITELRSSGPVMMVGDGINDAPALAAADVGVAMGAAGSDAALETADIALMSDALDQLPFIIRLSRKALSTIRLNIWFAITIKALAVLLVFPGWLSLWLAILADTGAAIIVTLNGMRLLRTK